MTTGTERIATLDIVRGVAVMGILLLNIVGFGMPDAAYMNPRAYGTHGPADLAVYLVNFVLFDGKMRGLFSFLFGAAMLLVIDRAEAKGESAARVHFARMAWLFAFGIAHMLLLWWGDILHHYAIIGTVAFAFRNAPVHRLIAVGVALLLLELLLLSLMPIGIMSAKAGLASGDPAVVARSTRALAGFVDGFGIPAPTKIAAELARYRGGYGGMFQHRVDDLGKMVGNTVFIGAETLGYMLLGMAALRSGMLTGGWNRRRYMRWAAIGFGIGIPTYIAIAAWLVVQDFAMLPLVTGVMVVASPLRPAMIVAWAALIILLARPGGALTARIGAAGRMAFTNYLATSIVMTTLFYGYGFGLFGTLGRAALYVPVAAMWALMLLWSKPWLERFRYGPFEWAWRSLARGRLQPMRGGSATG